MTSRYPIQRIRHFKCQQRGLLAATAGPAIEIFDTETGSQLSKWPSDANTTSSELKPSPDRGTHPETGAEPPGKRRKLSPPVEDGEAQAEKGEDIKSAKSGSSTRAWFTIPILVVSATGDHIIAVTGEDKCLRTFEVQPDGTLTQLAPRFMPKRPCAVTLTPDNSTILCGDKFGDVYSLPLLPKGDVVLPLRKSVEAPKTAKPSATTLTVHTQRNLQALEQQLRHPRAAQEKSGNPLELKLLLGHVSMLTDMALVSIPSSNSVRPRSYIITSDRDEHIRVSRGPSQAHIIHGYCLGHTSFVSRLCILPWDPKVLLSGGGDDSIFCWDWLEGRILQKVSIAQKSDSHENEGQAQQSDLRVTAVSGIWATSFAANSELSRHAKGAIWVALEGVPKLLPLTDRIDGGFDALAPIELSGNALDVVVLDDRGTILVSIDNIHQPGCTKELRDTALESPLLQCFSISTAGELKWQETPNPTVEAINAREAIDIITDTEGRKRIQAISNSLYWTSHLKKWIPGQDE